VETEVVADPLAEIPPELLAKPFKDLTKEEKILVNRAKSRAMRVKAGLATASPVSATTTASTPAPSASAAAAPAPEEVEEEASSSDATDPMADVPAELLAKSFKDLTKEERIIVNRAKSRAMRTKAGKPVGRAEA
jgi:hypothetical protein